MLAQSRWTLGSEIALGMAGHLDNELTTFTSSPGNSTTIDFAVSYQPIMHIGGWVEYTLSDRNALRMGVALRHMQFKNFTDVTTVSTTLANTFSSETITTREKELALPLQWRRYSLANAAGNRWWWGAGLEMNYLLGQTRLLQMEYSDATGVGGYYEIYSSTYESTTRRLLSYVRGMAQGEIGWQRGRAQLSLLAAFAFLNTNRYAARDWDCLNCDFVGNFLGPRAPGLGLYIDSPAIRSRRWRSLSLRLAYRL